MCTSRSACCSASNGLRVSEACATNVEDLGIEVLGGGSSRVGTSRAIESTA
jgi:hypothetical protein